MWGEGAPKLPKGRFVALSGMKVAGVSHLDQEGAYLIHVF
jgi:hypothetical protein